GPARTGAEGTAIEEGRALSVRLSTAGTQMNAQSDGLSALGASLALLVGLLAKLRGRPVPPMATSMLGTSVYAASNHLFGDRASVTPDPELYGLGPLYRLYETSDGWIFLAAPKAQEWESLTQALAPYADLANDHRL